MSVEQRALVNRLVDEVINRNELDKVSELFAPDLADGVRQALAVFRASFPDWHETIVDAVSENDRIAVRFRCSGTFRGDTEFLGLKPNERRQEVDEVFFLRVQGGRFVEYWGLEDNLSRLRQLGPAS